MVFGGRDCREHGAEGVLAVAQQPGLVPRDEGRFGNRLFDREVAFHRADGRRVEARTAEHLATPAHG